MMMIINTMSQLEFQGPQHLCPQQGCASCEPGKGIGAVWVPVYPQIVVPETWVPCGTLVPPVQLGSQATVAWPAFNRGHQQISSSTESHPAPLQGQVWTLAKDQKGCGIVQQALEDSPTDAARLALASELHAHVWEALNSPHANHVIQKCIKTMRPHDFQFIIDELMQAGPGAASKAAQHQYGCRILQRLFEFSSADQLQPLVEDLLENSGLLCKDMYASFVLQHLLEHGHERQISKLMSLLTEGASSIALDPYGVSVLEKAFYHACEEDREALANALVAQPTLLLQMSSWRHGHHAAKLALQAIAPQQRQPAIQFLQERKQKLQGSRYGKKTIGVCGNTAARTTRAFTG
jgi:hypothetical protein